MNLFAQNATEMMYFIMVFVLLTVIEVPIKMLLRILVYVVIDIVPIALMVLLKVVLLVKTQLFLLTQILKFAKNSALMDISEIVTLKNVKRVVHFMIPVLVAIKLVLLNASVLMKEPV